MPCARCRLAYLGARSAVLAHERAVDHRRGMRLIPCGVACEIASAR
jgi:hypothetical protein